MGQERRSEAIIEELEEQRPESRRHRPAGAARFAEPPAAGSRPEDAALGGEARAHLWAVVRGVLLAQPRLLRRVWTGAPVGALADRFPEDGAAVVGGWFASVAPADVYDLLERLYEALEPGAQARFAAAINTAFERGRSQQRFVMRRVVPIGSRSEAASIERAIAACKALHWAEVEIYMLDALGYLAEKPLPDTRESVQSAARAVQHAAVAFTHEQYLDFDDALRDLESKGHIARTLRAAYAGLVAYGHDVTRNTTVNEARLVLVTCANFVTHLASRMSA